MQMGCVLLAQITGPRAGAIAKRAPEFYARAGEWRWMRLEMKPDIAGVLCRCSEQITDVYGMDGLMDMDTTHMQTI